MRIRKRVFIVAASLAMACFVGLNKKESYSSNKEDIILRNEDIRLKIENKVDQSDNNLLKDILENGKENINTYKILEDETLYPNELLELAAKKSEVIDFVADYPNYKDNTNEKISIEKDYNSGEIPLFIQWDKRWGYDKYGSNFMAVNGCGPTSLAMVSVGLTGNTNINPKVVADYSEANGYLVENIGTKWSLMIEGAKEFGVVGTEIPLSEYSILKALKKGQPIIASMAPGTFTTSGHYIVLTGVDSDGKIIVNDSDSKIRSEKTWDIDIFLKETKNLWSFREI